MIEKQLRWGCSITFEGTTWSTTLEGVIRQDMDLIGGWFSLKQRFQRARGAKAHRIPNR